MNNNGNMRDGVPLVLLCMRRSLVILPLMQMAISSARALRHLYHHLRRQTHLHSLRRHPRIHLRMSQEHVYPRVLTRLHSRV